VVGGRKEKMLGRLFWLGEGKRMWAGGRKEGEEEATGGCWREENVIEFAERSN
jgi:hypothetical protein